MTNDETLEFTPKYDDQGLIGAIIQDGADGAVLMFAHMNQEAFAATQRTGFIHFWSRSRQKLWMKGETSGETFKVQHIAVDCDQDCLLITVAKQAAGKACHTGRRSCFYRAVEVDGLKFIPE